MEGLLPMTRIVKKVPDRKTRHKTKATHQLLWIAYGPHRHLAARTVDGCYVIQPLFGDRRKKGKLPFFGFVISFVTWSDSLDDDPFMADAEEGGVRVIATGVQDEAEAKKIAQADADTIDDVKA
ncbi:MAG: hypothetical protein E7813_25775 [Bradyrhizobium sp.]|uniref:hypothetical protein n=1 Tax=Bradyrhizobium sp. TaxID=376 RepID=UPI00120D3DD7|nr:hypothetical protein [Bradyrhizobium sp.]THD58768.1 MAG: hypothetical protein E7813_25775 [Bradyrhizobium sp.]